MSQLRSLILPAYLGLCLVLGGASNGGFAANLVLQLLALVLLVAVFWSPREQSLSWAERSLVLLLVLAIVLVVLQFLPLPLSLWELSGGRAQLLADSASVSAPLAPLLVALAPHEALASAVWMLPALAIGAAMLRWRPWQPEYFAWTLVLVMAASVGLGATQLAGGQQAPTYFYANTNREMTVGFFANANHLASLLLVSLPFLAALARHAARRAGQRRTGIYLVLGAFALVAVVGIAANGSLAGLGLLLPVLAASSLILLPSRLVRKVAGLALVVAVGGAAAIVLASEELGLVLGEASAFAPGGREAIWATTWTAVRDFLPLGSGLGSFAEVYRLYEDPALVEAALINHAHNDYLEVLLELGAGGAVLLAAFLVWWCRRAVRIWRSGAATPFAWAAMVASGTLLVHSFVDYPLRTAGLGSLFLVCCVMMTEWVAGDGFLMLARRPAGGAGDDPAGG